MYRSEWRKIILIIIVTIVLVGGLQFFLFKGIQQGPVPLSRPAVLELTLSGTLEERFVEDPLAEALGTSGQGLNQLLATIRKATFDPKIRGILLRVWPMETGWAKINELREALLRFKQKDKLIYAYSEAAGNGEYYLMSVADSIYFPPEGMLMVNGLSSSPLYLKGTLQKMGIQADFVAYGEYKSAPEMFTRSEPSPPAAEETKALLDDFFNLFVDTLAASRKMPATTIRALINQGLFTPVEVVASGLADTLMYYGDVKEKMKSDLDVRRMVSFEYYRKTALATGEKARQRIAVIYGIGTIVVGSAGAYGQDGVITSDGMAKAIREAADNKNIKAIILRMDSPGGSATAADIIWKEVVRARRKKPVIVSVSDMAASGGYYISMAADTIIAHPQSLVGSIGVFAGKFATAELHQKIGANRVVFKRGKNADIFSFYTPFSEDQRRLIKNFIMYTYRDFVSKAAEGRHKSFEEIDRIARGRVWSGVQGVNIGLVDKLGDFDEAVQTAKRMAGIPEEEKVILVTYPRIKPFIERLVEELLRNQARQTLTAVQHLFPEAGAYWSVLQALPLFRPGEPLAIIPYLPVIQ